MIADFCELDCCIIFESNIPFAKICVQRFNNTLANNHLYCDVLLKKEGLFLLQNNSLFPLLKKLLLISSEKILSFWQCRSDNPANPVHGLPPQLKYAWRYHM